MGTATRGLARSHHARFVVSAVKLPVVSFLVEFYTYRMERGLI